VFAHVDINNCYVSCETLFNPTLKGRVVVVLSNNDGCVIARSNEAKAAGIKMGDAEFLVRRRQLKELDAVIFSSNYALYADMSARMMNNLARYTYMLMVYSIDEAFLALGNIAGIDLEVHVATISKNVMRDTGLSITVVLPLRWRWRSWPIRPPRMKRNFLVLDTSEKIDKVVLDFPIEDVWGVGRQYYDKLTELGIKSAEDFRQMKADLVRQYMTVQGWRLHQELWGNPCNVIKDVAERSKGIESSQSFNTYQTELEQIEEASAMHAATVAVKLRQQKSMALMLTIYLRTNKHNEKHDQHYPSITVKVPFATNSTQQLTKICVQALRAIYQPGYNYLKTGVRATGIIPAGEVQFNLFSNYDSSKQDALSTLMDDINARYGRGALRVAAEGYDKTWKMKQEFLSKQYTTNWKEIIVAK